MRPRTNHSPAMLREDGRLPAISFAVLRELRSPVIRVRSRLRPVFGATMPPAAVDEEDDSPAREYHVRTDRTLAGDANGEVGAIPQTTSVEGPTDRQLRLRVGSPIRLHDARPESGTWRVRGRHDLAPDAMRA